MSNAPELTQERIDQILSSQTIVDYEKQFKDKNFELLTSIRYDPRLRKENDKSSVFFLFHEHWQRLKFQIQYFEWDLELTEDYLLQKLLSVVLCIPNDNGETPYKLRVVLDSEGKVVVGVQNCIKKDDLLEGIHQLNELPIEILDPCTYYSIYIDKESLVPSCFTSFKTTKRDHYTKARERMLDNPHDYSIKQDVLLHSNTGKVMECTISNVAFQREVRDINTGELTLKWVTPLLSSGCLCGVTRRYLLHNEYIEEGPLDLKDVKQGEIILYFNAVVGVCLGIIQ